LVLHEVKAAYYGNYKKYFHPPMDKSININIGDVSISIAGNSQMIDWEMAPAYLPFISEGEPDIRVNMLRGMPDGTAARKFFGSYPIWDLYRSNGTSIIKFYDEMPGLARALAFETQIKKADLFFPDATDQFVDPFYGPVLELLMINYLAQSRGAVIHSCGIRSAENGLLFVGESGAGKSTLTRLWNRAADVEILSDDRTIVRKKDGDYWIYGTPWHGEAKFGSPRSVKLDRIFFIQHGPANSLRPIKGAVPVQNLLTCSFPPYWDTEGMEFTIDLFSDLTTTVPCYELDFKPDMDIVNFVNQIKVEEDRLSNLLSTTKTQRSQSKDFLSNREIPIG
jgi:hypothetical protein